MRWHYGLIALVGLAIGWSSSLLWRGFALWGLPVKVQPYKVSLGEVVEGETVSFTVQIVNNTDHPLQLVRVNPSTCGCLLKHRKFPKAISPHSRVSFTLGLKAENLPDRFREHLTFVLTAPSGATFTPTVTLTGKVLRELVIDPALLDFGKVMLGDNCPKSLTLHSLTGQNFLVESVEAPPEVKVSFPSSLSKEANLRISFSKEANLRISFHPQERTGWREGQIKLRLKGLYRREVVIPFRATVEGVVDTEPNFLNFGIVAPKGSKTISFRIVNRSGKEIRLRLVSRPIFTKVIPIKPNLSEWQVELRVLRHVLPSQILSGKIIFQTPLSLQPLLEVPIFAAVEKANEPSQPYKDGRLKSHAEGG